MINSISFRSIQFAGSILLLFFILSSCSDDKSSNPTDSIPTAKIAVFSDPHLYDPLLGTNGNAFQQYLMMDRKLIAESDAIMKSIINSIKSSDVNIVIVPGDLTKDGEKQSHEKLAAYFKELENAGKKVFVVPGNHDVNNPASFGYESDYPTPVANISKEDFSSIYNDFGFEEAISKDPNSLSYVAEPVKGLWLLGMDPCRYNENDGNDHSVTGGRFSTETLNWIKSQLSEAKTNNKIVIGFMHHGIIEHFTGQKSNPVSNDYVIDDFESVGSELSALGLKIVLTGHFHANDIVKKTWNESFMFDIETGSLVTSPCPWRKLELTQNEKLIISTNFISSIDYDTGNKSFKDYASDYLRTGMEALVTYSLINDYGLSEQEAGIIAPAAAGSFIAHYAGDETITIEAQQVIAILKQNGDAASLGLASSIESLFTDLPPADNNITIDLKTGNVE